MAEVVGLIGSTVSIIALAKSCIDLYDIVDDCKHAAEDQDQLVSLLKIERVKVFFWCQYVGLTELVRLREANGTNFDLDDQEIFRLTPKLEHSFIRDVMIKALRLISQDFESSHELLESYTNKKIPSALSCIMKQKPFRDGNLNLAEEVFSVERSY